MSSTDDRELACRAQQGDREAFAEIVRRHQRAVFGAAYRILADAHAAEDAAQEVFIRAFRFFSTYDVGRPLAPWLNRITVNVCLNRLENSGSAGAFDAEAASAADPEPGPEKQVLLRNRAERIQSELQRLPPRFRAVIELRHFQELSYEEIAQVLEQPLNSVKSDLFRARKLLSERLRDLL